MHPGRAAAAAPRVVEAPARFEPTVRDALAAADLLYPPKALHLCAYNLNRFWRSGTRRMMGRRSSFISMFYILGLSGALGAKRCEGDLQVPEVFYRITHFNPKSRFYLSFGFGYLSASDRQLAPAPATPGSDIFIHGGEQSLGCLAIGDDALAFLYLAAVDTAAPADREISVHLFPCRTITLPGRVATLAAWRVADPTLHPFWQTLARGAQLVERTRRLPVVRRGSDGGCDLGSEPPGSPRL